MVHGSPDRWRGRALTSAADGDGLVANRLKYGHRATALAVGLADHAGNAHREAAAAVAPPVRARAAADRQVAADPLGDLAVAGGKRKHLMGDVPGHLEAAVVEHHPVDRPQAGHLPGDLVATAGERAGGQHALPP